MGMRMPSADKGFSEWSQHVLEQLVQLNLKYEALREDYHQLNQIITGNGSPGTGMVVRLDRLEQESERRSLWVKAAIGASVTAIFSCVGLLIKTLKP
jgi:hypothetical protein